MKYTLLKKSYITGWHTWNVRSVLSHVHMPDGFSVNLALKEYREGHYLKEVLVGRFANEHGREPTEIAIPGIHAFDESYTEMSLKWCDMEIRVESAVVEDELLLLVTPVKKQMRPAMLVLEGGFLWGSPGWVENVDNVLIGHCTDRDCKVYTTGRRMVDLNIPAQTAFLSVVLDGPVAFSTGKSYSLAETRQLIDKHKILYTGKNSIYGEMLPMYEAMEAALMWDTIYDAKHDRVISPVSRLWSIESGGYVLFCWDTFFAGFMAGIGSKELAYSNLYGIMDEQISAGFIPNFAYATGQVSTDRSQPPVGSAMLLEIYRMHHDKWIINDLYEGLLQWNSWFAEHRMNSNGALCWGSEKIKVLYGNRWEKEGVHDRFGASLESGLDNSPMYDDVPFNQNTNRLELEDVGLTGLYILDCRSLIELADEIGRKEDIPELERRMNAARAGLEGLWDEKFGFYCNRRTDTGKYSHRISPTNFYALFSPDVSIERQKRIALHYFNKKEFYGEWMLPSIARNDPAFSDQNYWRGRIWAPLNFLTYLALTRTGLADVRRDLAEKSSRLFLKEWTEHRHVHENYNANTGEGCDSSNSDRFYHWGALLCVISMAEAGYIKNLGMPLSEKTKEENKEKQL